MHLGCHMYAGVAKVPQANIETANATGSAAGPPNAENTASQSANPPIQAWIRVSFDQVGEGAIGYEPSICPNLFATCRPLACLLILLPAGAVAQSKEQQQAFR
jgi:hypothetical protein